MNMMSREDKLKLAEYLRGKVEKLEGLAGSERMKEQIDRLWETVRELESRKHEKVKARKSKQRD